MPGCGLFHCSMNIIYAYPVFIGQQMEAGPTDQHHPYTCSSMHEHSCADVV